METQELIQRKWKILLIDDSQIHRFQARIFLRKFQCDVVDIDNGKAALDILYRDHSYDLILIDYLMPRMNGYEFLVEAEKIPLLAGITKIMLTAVDNVELVKECMRRKGVKDYICKPFTQNLFEERISRVLDEISQERKEKEDAREAQMEHLKSLVKIRSEQVINLQKLALMGEIAGGVAHELKNPLQVSSVFLMLLKEMVDDQKENTNEEGEVTVALGPEMVEALENSLHSHDRMETIINNLNTFCRKDSGQRTFHDIVKLIRCVISMSDAKTKINFSPPTKEINVPIIASKVEEVLINLLNNAAHAIKGKGKDGKIDINIRNGNGTLYIDVSDNGYGIPDDIKEKIFDAFFTTKDVGEGTGLGLAICNKIIVDHGGEIKVVSKLGAGTTFTIELPIPEGEENDEDE